jgi:uncharacterized protein YjbJ (UPF0337 family)
MSRLCKLASEFLLVTGLIGNGLASLRNSKPRSEQGTNAPDVMLRLRWHADCSIASGLIYNLPISLLRSFAMNADQIKGNWKQLKGKIKTQWGKLTDDDLTVIDGEREQLLGKLQERYGYTKEQAERELARQQASW